MNKKTHGGQRPGAGRKPGSNRFGEPTTRVRIPQSCLLLVENLLAQTLAGRPSRLGGLDLLRPADHCPPLARPLFSSCVPAGFPSPADDYIEGQLDLNEYFVQHPSATFYVRVTGDSMQGAGIFPGDILIVDRSLEAVHGSVVIAVVNDELTVKRLYRQGATVALHAENPAFPAITFQEGMELVIWGVVSGVTRKL